MSDQGKAAVEATPTRQAIIGAFETMQDATGKRLLGEFVAAYCLYGPGMHCGAAFDALCAHMERQDAHISTLAARLAASELEAEVARTAAEQLSHDLNLADAQLLGAPGVSQRTTEKL